MEVHPGPNIRFRHNCAATDIYCHFARERFDVRQHDGPEQAAKMSHRRLIISLQLKTKILLTTVAGRSSMDLMAEGSKTCSPKRFYLSLSELSPGLASLKPMRGARTFYTART